MESTTKKTKPTTVRLFPELDSFVRELAETHPNGQSGVLNDAVQFYMESVDGRQKKSDFIQEVILNSHE